MAKLMIKREVLEDARTYPKKVYNKLIELHRKFEDDSTQASLHVEPLQPMVRDPKVRSARLGLDYRAILVAPEVGDTYVLVYVDHHDKAYRWCENKLFEAHSERGTFQIIDVENVERVAEAVQEKPVAPYFKVPEYCLNKLTDEELFHAGTPKALIPSVRAVQSDEDFERMTEFLPSDARHVLYGFVCGLSLDQAIEEMLGVEETHYKPENPGDFSHLAEAPNIDLVLIEGEEHLRDILTKDIEAWRVFLHPYQRNLVEWNVKGPMKINGAAGTGKTVVVMHRAVWLARQLKPGEKVLITTFTTNLAVTINALVKDMAPELVNQIEVINLHKLAHDICKRAGIGTSVITKEGVDACWEKVFIDLGHDNEFSPTFIRDEYDQIIDRMGIENEAQYLTAIRTGRPRIMKKQRQAIWPYFSAFQKYTAESGMTTFEGVVHQARMIAEKKRTEHYRHVLVDELQDFGLEALRLIKAISPVDDGLSNPLCVVGDGHQRLYNRVSLPLSKAGINVTGRSRRLKINYRTTEQIRNWSQGILSGVPVDDLDGGAADTTADRSVFFGNEPVLKTVRNIDLAADETVSWVTGLLHDSGKNIKEHEICITPMYAALRGKLQQAGIAICELVAGQQDPGQNIPGVRYGSKKRIKGLEFKAVGLLLNRDSTDSLSRFEDYVAATRAREELLVVNVNSMSS